MDVNKAIQRSLTKACARHGLGLYIYAGEDLPEDASKAETKPEKQEPTKAETKPKKQETPKAEAPTCEMCGNPIRETTTGTGKVIPAEQVAHLTKEKYGACLCSACAYTVKKTVEATA
jgi:ribosomal protein L34E